MKMHLSRRLLSIGIIFSLLPRSYAMDKSQSQKETIICGVVNDTSTSVTIRLENFSQILLYGNYSTSIKRITVPIVQGKFKFRFSIPNFTYVIFEGHSNVIKTFFNNSLHPRHLAPLPIEPGDSFHIDLVSCGGCSNRVSGFGVEKVLCMQAMTLNSEIYDSPFLPEVPNRIALSDSIRTMILNTVSFYSAKLSHTAKVVILANSLLQLPLDISEIISGDERFRIPSLHFNDSLKEEFYRENKRMRKILDFSDTALAFCSHWIEGPIKQQAFLYYAIEHNKQVKYLSQQEKFIALSNYLPQGPLRLRVLGNFLCKETISGYSETLDSAFSTYINNENFNSPYYKVVLEHWKFLQNGLISKREAYKFTLQDTTGRIHTLDDYKGKVVLLDFMFRGCAGCISMAKTLNNFHLRFDKDTNVIFIAISIDKSIDDWKKAIGTTSALNAIQLYTDGLGDNHPIAKYYIIKSCPTLVLIGPDSKVISARAPDPRKDNGEALFKIINDNIKSTPN